MTDRVRLRFAGGEMANRVFDAQGELIANETLAVDVSAADETDWEHSVELDVAGETVRLWVQKTD